MYIIIHSNQSDNISVLIINVKCIML